MVEFGIASKNNQYDIQISLLLKLVLWQNLKYCITLVDNSSCLQTHGTLFKTPVSLYFEVLSYIEKSTDKKERSGNKAQFYPAKFDIDVSVCMSCQICVEVCPFDAIVMNSQFELSTPDRFGGLLLRRDDLLKSNDY